MTYPEIGWQELRDQNGVLWAEYHPGIQTIRRRKKLHGDQHFAYISVTALLRGAFDVDLVVEDVNKR
jgi:hypothetical protein